MRKLCLLVMCLASASDGRRLTATLAQHLRSQGVGRRFQGTLDRPPSRQAGHAGSEAHGAYQIESYRQAQRSSRGQLPKSRRNVIPILLTFICPSACIFSSLSNSTGARDDTCCSHGTDKSGRSPVGEPVVRVTVSVDWEGQHLHKEDLLAFKHLRAEHPEVALTHFLNAAYFTSSAEQSRQEWSPHEALSPIDELGLHVHTLRSLVEASGVRYRSAPSVLQTPEQVAQSREYEKELRHFVQNESDWENASERNQVLQYLGRDEGHEADIRAYTSEELQAIIFNSKAILRKQGLEVGKSFRAGAWLGGPNVLEAIRREGFLVNSSAVDFEGMIGRHVQNLPPEVEQFWRTTPLFTMLGELWPEITSESQPFFLGTPVGCILEMPDTGGLADYTSAEDMVDHIDNAVHQLDSQDRFVHIGFHQEGAATTIESIIATITEIKRKHGHRVVFETLEASAQHARSMPAMKLLEFYASCAILEHF